MVSKNQLQKLKKKDGTDTANRWASTSDDFNSQIIADSVVSKNKALKMFSSSYVGIFPVSKVSFLG